MENKSLVLSERETKILNQTEVAERVGSRYVPIKTQDMLTVFGTFGFEMTHKPTIVKTRKASNEGFQKHLTRLSNPSLTKHSGEIPEIVVVNSYNGLGAVKLMLGMYRLICSNGLIVGDTYETYTVKHMGDVVSELSQAIESILDDHSGFLVDVDHMKDVTLSVSQVEELADKASKVILPDDAKIVNLQDLLRVRRPEDKGQDLWSVFNVVQENSLSGGIQYNTPVILDVLGQPVKHNQPATRRIKSVDSTVRVNKELWNIAMGFAA